jgi:hypothetical protein
MDSYLRATQTFFIQLIRTASETNLSQIFNGDTILPSHYTPVKITQPLEEVVIKK